MHYYEEMMTVMMMMMTTMMMMMMDLLGKLANGKECDFQRHPS